MAMLDKPHDFAIDEEMIRDPDAATFAKTPEEAAERWRQRVKFDLLKEITDDVPMDEAVEKLRKRYDSIRKSWKQTDNDELLERYLTAMTTGFDPHSSYMSPSTLENFNIRCGWSSTASAPRCAAKTATPSCTTSSPAAPPTRTAGSSRRTRSSASARATSGEIVDIVDMKLNDVVKKIRGKRGTIVRLEVDPGRRIGPQDLHDHPRPHRAQGQRSPQRDHRARHEAGRHSRTASASSTCPASTWTWTAPAWAARLTRARPATSAGCSKSSSTKNVDAVVIDLRWNGGGSLTEAVNMTGLFIDNGRWCR